ncbi:MAG: hypothetical protein U9Q66_01825 [Patescibacteria group bacterium]|nr:hypothetical protein [Patescibacteria group bacterium]
MNLVKTSVGHFSAHTTAYLTQDKSSHLAKLIIILRKVGVAVIAVTFECLIISRIVFASFGSGVHTSLTHDIKGMIVFTVNQKL